MRVHKEFSSYTLKWFLTKVPKGIQWGQEIFSTNDAGTITYIGKKQIPTPTSHHVQKLELYLRPKWEK